MLEELELQIQNMGTEKIGLFTLDTFIPNQQV